MKRSWIFLFILLFVFMSFAASAEGGEEGVPLEEKIGQMLMVGFRGLTVDEDSQIARDISAGRVGGVILFDYDVALDSSVRNISSPEQVRELVSTLKSFSDDPLFVAVDQEGGKVSRLKEKYGFPATVSQEYLGEEDDPELTRYYAARTANALADMGFNLNFAPVVDLNVNPDNPAIGKLERSFSAEPDVVLRNAEIVIEELYKKGIKSCLKHFPGHGSSAGDSHEGITDVTETWSEVELEPYRQIISGGKADFIMTAHIFNRNWDPKYPATLSRDVITGILRDELGFDGVVFSDDLNMGAIREQYSLEETIRLAINAGVDVLIFANNLTYDEMIAVKAVDIIQKLVEEGEIPESRIDESYSRIMEAKN